MELTLDDGEIKRLASALELHLLRLRTELVHTEQRAFRVALRRDIDALEKIQERLTRAANDRRRPGRQPL